MKKIALTLIAVVLTAFASTAADITEIWNAIKADKGMTVADIPAEEAQAEGFLTTTVALNTNPTSADIERILTQVKFINDNQKLTAVTQNSVDVAIYAAPADAQATTYKVLVVITSDAAEKALVCVYGTCTADQMQTALSSFQIGDLIGG